MALSASPARYDLTESNPTRAALPYPTRELLCALDNEAARVYAPDPRGLDSARVAIAQRMSLLGVSPRPEQVFLTSGTSEAYGYLFKLLCDPGDEVLVPEPSYPLFSHLCRLENVNAVPYPLHYDGQWYLGISELERAITRRTRALLVVSPNNPTGSYLKRHELTALAALGLPIVSDEVFASYELRGDPSRVHSALMSDRTLVFTLHGLSKAAALPQWKVSWMCLGGPSELVSRAAERLEIIADTYLSVATPTQHALPELLRIMEPTRAAIHARLARNLRHLRAALTKSSPLSLLDVEGGFYATLRLPQTQSEEQWVLDFLEHEGVHVQPGYFFDFPSGAHAVLSLLTREDSFDAGVARILRRVEQSL